MSMSKAVLISIQPKWCEKIVNGEKTIEVRKNRPQLEPPFKCYIYCTKPKQFIHGYADDDLFRHIKDGSIECGFSYQLATETDEEYNRDDYILSGKVIGEFVCDGIVELAPVNRAPDNLEDLACLTREEIVAYIKGKGYGWHISDLVIYDHPKKLSEFEKYSEDENRPCANGKDCEYLYFDYSENCEACSIDFDGANCPFVKVSRPPQSWCYVEEVHSDG